MQLAGLEPFAFHPNFTAMSLLALALFLCSHQTGGSSKRESPQGQGKWTLPTEGSQLWKVYCPLKVGQL